MTAAFSELAREYQTKIKDCKLEKEKDDLIKDLLSRGWDINKDDDEYDSDEVISNPLKSACEYRIPENIKVLLSNGASTDNIDFLELLFTNSDVDDNDAENIKDIIEMVPDINMTVEKHIYDDCIKPFENTCLQEIVFLIGECNGF